MITIYEHNGKELFKDEESAYEIEDIRVHYAQFNKELLSATYTVVLPENEGDPRKVIFAKKTGTKGVGDQTIWVSVDERLPENDQIVIVFCPEWDRSSVGYYLKDNDFQSGWTLLEGGEYGFADWPVSHWMPLPPPPEMPPLPPVEAPAGDGYAVKNFTYNGFSGQCRRSFAPYRATFVEWTSDPGVGWFDCSDGERRQIPTFALPDFDTSQYPKQPKTGVVFGQWTHS